MAASTELIDTVANANTKTIAEAAAHSMALAMQNAVSHQNAMAQVNLAAVGNIVKRLTEVDPIEASSVLRAGGANMPDFAAMIALAQQLTKSAQTTPPATA